MFAQDSILAWLKIGGTSASVFDWILRSCLCTSNCTSTKNCIHCRVI